MGAAKARYGIRASKAAKQCPGSPLDNAQIAFERQDDIHLDSGERCDIQRGDDSLIGQEIGGDNPDA